MSAMFACYIFIKLNITLRTCICLQMLSVYQPKGLKVIGAMSVVRNSVGSGLLSHFVEIIILSVHALYFYHHVV